MNPVPVFFSRGTVPRVLVLASLAAGTFGCGGGPVPTSAAAGPRIALLASAPTGSGTPAEGFDASGAPVYAAADASGLTWGVYASKDRLLYSMAIAGVTASEPDGVAGKYVVGTYRDAIGPGTVVASLNGDGSVSAPLFAGYGYVACDSGKALVTNPGGASAGYSLIDLASGSVTAEAIPPGATPLALKGRFVLCGGTSPAVFDTGSGTFVAMAAAAGTDGTVSALAVNAAGQALGATTTGGLQQLREWGATGTPGGVLDSAAAGETFVLGCLSADGARMAYKKAGASYEHQFVRSGGVSYGLTPGSPYASLRDLNGDGTIGFAADLSADEARVTVSISYP